MKQNALVQEPNKVNFNEIYKIENANNSFYFIITKLNIQNKTNANL